MRSIWPSSDPEAYYGRWSSEDKHTMQSITKSIVSALIGIALEQGCLQSLDDPIWRYFPDRIPENNDVRKQEITLKHLLTMTSGFEWDHEQTPFSSSPDRVQFVLDQPMVAQPGAVWNYNSGNTHLLSAIIQNSCGMNALDYANAHLFGPLGITDVEWKTDRQGTPDGGGGLFMTPRDMARIGLLYLNEGTWDGEQIVPAAWINASRQKYVQVPQPLEPWGLYVGYSWWIHDDGLNLYTAHGHGGQFIYILPEQNTVVVFTGDVDDAEFVEPQRLIREYIIPAVR